MMTVLTIALVALSLVASPGGAERLDEILAEMEKAGEQLRTLTADFQQTDHDAILQDQDLSRGKLYLELPGSVRWEHVEPAPKVLLIRDELVRVYNVTAAQVDEFKQDSAGRAGGMNLLVGFGSSTDEIAKNYDASLVEETASNVVLKLDPKPDSPASLFTAIVLTVDKKTWTPVRSVFHESNRDHTDIDFENVVINKTLPKDVFELDLPDDVVVIEH